MYNPKSEYSTFFTNAPTRQRQVERGRLTCNRTNTSIGSLSSQRVLEMKPYLWGYTTNEYMTQSTYQIVAHVRKKEKQTKLLHFISAGLNHPVLANF